MLTFQQFADHLSALPSSLAQHPLQLQHTTWIPIPVHKQPSTPTKSHPINPHRYYPPGNPPIKHNKAPEALLPPPPSNCLSRPDCPPDLYTRNCLSASMSALTVVYVLQQLGGLGERHFDPWSSWNLLLGSIEGKNKGRIAPVETL